MRKMHLPILGLVLSVALTCSCSGKDDDKIIRMVTRSYPYYPTWEILNNPIKDYVQNESYAFSFEDLGSRDEVYEAVSSKASIFAMLFETFDDMLTYNREHNTKLRAVFGTYYERLGIYNGKSSSNSLKNMENGASVAYPKGDVFLARSLNLLAAQNIITLKDGVGLDAKLDDIVDNPKNINFVALDEIYLWGAKSVYDYIIARGVYGIKGEFPNALAFESSSGSLAKAIAKDFTVVVAVKDTQFDDPRVEVLQSAFQSSSFKNYIRSNYGNGVVYNYLTAKQLYNS